MIIDKTIIDGKEVTTITAEEDKILVRVNGGVLLCKTYTLNDEDKLSDFIEVDEGNNYKVERRNAYPSEGAQLDMIWHCIDEGKPLDKECEFYLARKAVKDKYPKEVEDDGYTED